MFGFCRMVAPPLRIYASVVVPSCICMREIAKSTLYRSWLYAGMETLVFAEEHGQTLRGWGQFHVEAFFSPVSSSIFARTARNAEKCSDEG